MSASTSTTLACDFQGCPTRLVLPGVGDNHLARMVGASMVPPWSFDVGQGQRDGALILPAPITDFCPEHSA